MVAPPQPPEFEPENIRGQVQFVDVILTFFVLVGLMALAPVMFTFVGMIQGPADAFSGLLLEMVLPLLFIGLLISIGISARGGS